MKRLIAVLALLVTALPAVAADPPHGISGAWTASIDEERKDQLELSMRYRKNNNNGTRFRRSDLIGLTAVQIASPTSTPVHFELRREAGVVSFDGSFRDGDGAGQFSFAPNREFPRTLKSLGVAFTPDRGDEDQELFHLAIFDVSSAFIRSMQAIGYRLTLEKYVECRIFDVDPDYVREMRAIGYDHLSADKLVETRIHGATPEYIRAMRAEGEDLTLDGYIESRIFQVTPEFKAELRQLGYGNLDRDELTQFVVHGVSADFIRDIAKLGYKKVPPEQLVQMRIHGVTPEFIASVEAAGYHHVPIEKMVQMRIFDIDPKMVRALDRDDD